MLHNKQLASTTATQLTPHQPLRAQPHHRYGASADSRAP